ncbi:MAG: hypothetical protein QM715_05610 [Nibricoccus sp.]
MEEEESETEATAKAEPNQSNEVNGAPPDEEGFVWPEGSAPTGAMVANGSAPDDERAPDTPLPSLDELVKRIPNAAREVLDELFRAKFVSVKRVEKTVLKN